MKQLIFSLCFIPLLLAIKPYQGMGVLELKINNIKHKHGTVWVGLYPSESAFLDKEKAILYSIKNPESMQTSIFIDSLEHGNYAIALFHDLNDNGTLDFSFWGPPSEPYAFSGSLKSKWRVPSFMDVKFSFFESEKVIVTTLDSWWNQ